jgi:glycosyltransferase involved in cell wall biosynthesis
MRLAVYHPWIYLKGGAERTLLELIRHSRHEWTVVTNHFEPQNTFPGFRELDVINLSYISVMRSIDKVAHAALMLLLQRFDYRQFDALMISNEGLGNLIALHRHLPPLFCFCHTPLKIFYDPLTRDKFYTQHRSWPLRLGIRLFLLVDRFGWRRYGRIFCNSEETRRRILKHHLAPQDKLEVLHPGLDLERNKMSNEREPYFLLPGRIMWTKNIELAIAAFKLLKRNKSQTDIFRLVIAGMLDQKSRSYYQELKRQASGHKDIQFVVSPDDKTLHTLYRKAWAVLNTSLNEDWGLTILEGMAFGKPVLAVNEGGPRESVKHGKTGFLCAAEPLDFARRMFQLASKPELALKLGHNAQASVSQFTWRAFSDRIDDYAEELVRSPLTKPKGHLEHLLF